MEQNVVHVVLTPTHAGVSVKLTRSVQGVSLEVDVNRLMEDGESYDEVAKDAARIAGLAYDEARAEAAALGLTIGKDPK